MVVHLKISQQETSARFIERERFLKSQGMSVELTGDSKAAGLEPNMRDSYGGRAMRHRLAGTDNGEQCRQKAETNNSKQRADLYAGERLVKRLSNSGISHHV